MHTHTRQFLNRRPDDDPTKETIYGASEAANALFYLDSLITSRVSGIGEISAIIDRLTIAATGGLPSS